MKAKINQLSLLKKEIKIGIESGRNENFDYLKHLESLKSKKKIKFKF
ncbi:hypothetical protein [Flavobacterium sp.]